MIWFEPYKLTDFKPLQDAGGLGAALGLAFTEIGDDYLKATLPVDERTRQPFGILHGGGTCVLVETLGSVASALVIDREKFLPVGSMIAVNHLRPVRSGLVTGICRPVYLGRMKHVWDVRVENDDGKLTAKGELTCAIVTRDGFAA